MSQLKRGDVDEFKHYAGKYGSIIIGATPEKRADFLRNTLKGPFIEIDCSMINSEEEFVREGLRQMNYFNGEESGKEILQFVDLGMKIRENDYSILILEFEELPDELQTSVAQFLKGLGERMGYEGMIGYACKERESVVRAESDLSMRIRPWVLEC